MEKASTGDATASLESGVIERLVRSGQSAGEQAGGADFASVELERIKALARYEVLDTAPEKIFDELTFLASQVCGFPVSLLTLVDESRQWFKSVVGLDTRETPRAISFCNYTIEQADIMVVGDATKDERFACNPLVTAGPKIRFYAGAPLTTPDGYRLGTLCVIDRVPREFTAEQKKILRMLADQAMSQLELRLSLRKLAARTLEVQHAYQLIGAKEKRFRALFEQAAIGVAEVESASGRFTKINRKLCEIIGYPPEQAETLNFYTFFGWQAAPPGPPCNGELAATGQFRVATAERVLNRRQGGEVWVEVSVSPLWEPGDPPGFYMVIVQDITERKRAQRADKASVEMAALLRRETHHRVKNNLQVIASLMFLQAEHMADPEVREIFRENQSRIRSIGLIHEKLYQSGDYSQIELSGYLRQLAAELFASNRVSPEKVRLEIRADEIFLGLDTATTCALIVNELLSNALKHAFPGARTGNIQLELRALPGTVCQLTVSDNGVGLPEGFTQNEASTLGVRLVCDLARQLGASVQFERRQGTRVSLQFGVPE